MKSRLLRALGVGAALLIPIGGVTLLGGGTAGANVTSTPPTLCFHATTSFVRLVYTVPLGNPVAGCVALHKTSTTKYTSTAAYSYTTAAKNITITVPVGTIVVKYGAGIDQVKFSSNTGASAELGTTGTFAHCEITTIPTANFGNGSTSAYPLHDPGSSLSGAVIKSYGGGTCSSTDETTIANKLASTDLTGTLYVH